MVRLQTMDKVFFDPVPEVIFQSVLVKELVSDFGDHNDDTHIPLSNIRSETLTKVIEFCERHRSDRPPLMKPYVPPPPPPRKPYWMMTAAEREAERLEGLVKDTVAASAASPTVKLEPQVESENAVAASGSGSGNSGNSNGNQQVGTNGAIDTPLDEPEIVEGDATGTAASAGAINTSDNALNGLEAAASKEANSGDGKDKDKVEAQPVEREEEDTPTMVPMTLAEVDQADDAWDKEFLKVDQDMLCSIILAANYLDIPSLLELGCKTIGAEVAGKTPAQVRELYGIPADYDVNDPPPPASGEDSEQIEQEEQATNSKTTRSKSAKRGKKRSK